MRSAHEVVVHIVQSNPGIETVTLVTYTGGPNWPELAARNERVSGELLLEGTQQDRGERILTQLRREEVSMQRLHNIIQSLGARKLLGVVSKVKLADGAWAHIPMMDFKCARSTKNQKLLVHLLKNVGRGQGWLLESGRSYHYYGCQLLNEEEWIAFLGKSLLMTGYTDDRYIGHQLVDGYCVLRLSSGSSKINVPTVVTELS